MKARKILITSLIVLQAQFALGQLAFAKGTTGAFTSDMEALYGAACTSMGANHSTEVATCMSTGHAFLNDPSQPAPCTSWRKDEYAIGMVQAICSKDINSSGWAKMRENCIDGAKAEMQKLGLEVPPELMDATAKCSVRHLHFTEKSQEKCIEARLGNAKQTEFAQAKEEEDAYQQAIASVQMANELESSGELKAEDRSCFAPIATAGSKIDPADVGDVFETITCAFAPADCAKAINAVSHAGVTH